MGSMRDGRLRLGSQNDRGMRGGEDDKIVSSTTVKIGTFRGGDNSSEEYIIDYSKEGIRTTTEVRVEREDEDSVKYGLRGNPFGDPKKAQEVVHAV
jgi:hypothetical protein